MKRKVWIEVEIDTEDAEVMDYDTHGTPLLEYELRPTNIIFDESLYFRCKKNTLETTLSRISRSAPPTLISARNNEYRTQNANNSFTRSNRRRAMRPSSEGGAGELVTHLSTELLGSSPSPIATSIAKTIDGFLSTRTPE